MRKLTLLAAFLCLLLASAVQAQTQVEQPPAVLICRTGDGCSYSVLSGQLSTAQLEALIADPQPQVGTYVLCDLMAVCTWTSMDYAEADTYYTGDGIPLSAVDQAALDASRGTPSLGGNVALVQCEGFRCRQVNDLLPLSEVTLMLGQPQPEAAAYVRCDTAGCRWEVLETGEIQPVDGYWRLSNRAPFATGCTELVTEDTAGMQEEGLIELRFSRPFQPTDLLEIDTRALVIEQTSPTSYRTSVNLLTDVTVTYEHVLISNTLINGKLFFGSINPETGGECLITVDFEYTFEAQ